VDWGRAFLHPGDPSQKPYPFNLSKPDDQIAKKLVLDQINLYGLSLDSLEIDTGIGSSNDVQLMKINLSVPDIQTANKSLTEFILSLEPMVNNINKQPGARIAVVWTKLIDLKGELLLEYFWDLELHGATWHMADGITGGWYSRPDVLEGEQTPIPTLPVSPTSTVQPYPPSSEYKDSSYP
jgi:hypothetical protein